MLELKNLRIGIVGWGLIGGSIALALNRKAGIKNIVALTRNNEAIRDAIQTGAIISGSTDDYSILRGCDIVFVCTPVAQIKDKVIKISEYCDGLITDVGSTKLGIIKSINELGKNIRFIGTHPMAGSEKVGFNSANENLFENAPYIICPTSENNKCDIDVLTQITKAMGACPIIMSPDKHDRAVGLISHLPHIASAALVGCVADEGEDILSKIAAGGFKDITRISSSNPEMWADIVEANDSLIAILSEYITRLQGIKQTLIDSNREKTVSFFYNAKVFRDQLKETKNVQLWVEVADRPGSIARIAACFGSAGINIRDIYIQDSREYEGGSLRITLKDASDSERAEKLLLQDGLQVQVIN